MPASRHRLLPGVPVLRRDDHHLQVGLAPDRAVVLPDQPGVRRALAAVRAGGATLDDPDPGGLALGPEPRHPGTAEDATARRTVRALAEAGLLEDPRERAARSAARGGCVVELDACADTTTRVLPLLDAVGLPAAEPATGPVNRLTTGPTTGPTTGLPTGGTTGLTTGPAAGTVVRLVVREGEIARSELDADARDGVPHLLVSAEPGAVTVGPFVSPGRSACLRCLDAHRSTADPRWGFLVEQAAAAPAVPRDPVLQPLALAWAVGDLRAWAERRTPSTWSATVRFRLAPDGGPEHERQEWRRHPGCGCAWGEALSAV